MKKYLVVTLCFLSLLSCQEEVSFNIPAIQGLKDSVFWRATNYKATLATDGSVDVQGFTVNETLHIKVSTTDSGIYLLGLNPNDKIIYEKTQGTGSIIYSSNLVNDGQIIITEFDAVKKTISGTFRFNAALQSNTILPDAAPILNFQQGVFYKVPIQ